MLSFQGLFILAAQKETWSCSGHRYWLVVLAGTQSPKCDAINKWLPDSILNVGGLATWNYPQRQSFAQGSHIILTLWSFCAPAALVLIYFAVKLLYCWFLWTNRENFNSLWHCSKFILQRAKHSLSLLRKRLFPPTFQENVTTICFEFKNVLVGLH